MYYKANRFAVSGPDETVEWPAYSHLMDYECELACVIGTGGVDIPRGRAWSTCSATPSSMTSAPRRAGREMAGGLGPAKGKDFDTPMPSVRAS